MEVQLRQVLGTIPALQRLQRERLPAPVAFRLARFLRTLEREARAFESTRTQILQQLQGGVDDDERRRVIAGLEDLLDETVEIELPHVAVEDLSHIEITTEDALALEWLLFEGGDGM